MSTLSDQLAEYGIERTGDAPDDPTLINQSEARSLAKAINDAGRVPAELGAVAHPVPWSSWGGQEKGWSVSMVPLAQYTGWGRRG